MHMLVLLGTIMVIFMGFAFDVGRLYLNRSELQTMASAMAIAAAQQLIGTETSTTYAGSAARAATATATALRQSSESDSVFVTAIEGPSLTAHCAPLSQGCSPPLPMAAAAVPPTLRSPPLIS